jgi:outer membrane protein TolC
VNPTTSGRPASRALSAAAPVLLCAGLLGACSAVAPHPLDASERAGALLARSFGDAGLRAFAASALGIALPAGNAAWDSDALTAAALYFNPRIARAAAETRGAEAAIETARALPNPTLSISPEYSVNPARGESPWSPAVQLEWPIATAGKRSHALDRATADALAQHFAFAAEIAAVERDVWLARIELATAADAARALEEETNVARELAEAWRARVALGAASFAEAAPAEAAALAASAELASAHEREAIARAALAEAVGVPIASFAQIQLAEVASAGAEAPPAGPGTALARRADVLAALARYASVEAALQGEVAKQFPDLRVGSGYQWDQGQSKFMLGVSFDLPILDRNAGPIAEALAARDRAAAELDATQTAALAEIERASASVGAARERREALRASVAALDAQAARSEQGLAAGALNRLDALAARGLALKARRDLREAEHAARAASVSLDAALAPARDDVDAIVRAHEEEP